MRLLDWLRRRSWKESVSLDYAALNLLLIEPWLDTDGRVSISTGERKEKGALTNEALIPGRSSDGTLHRIDCHHTPFW